MRAELRSILGMAALLVGSQLVALAVSGPFASAGMVAFQNPGDISNTAIYIVAILIFTALILGLVKYRHRDIARYVILASVFITIAFVLLLPILYLVSAFTSDEIVGGILVNSLPFALAAVVTWVLVKYPEWYVVDTVGLATAAGVTAILGISFSVLPALLLLIALAGYDAWAVYRTKHMVALADELTSQKLPVLLVVPKHADYKFSEQKSLKQQIASGEDREAMFIGLGDLIIPGVMAVSARAFLRDDIGLTVAGIAPSLLVAIATILGTLLGFAILMRFVLRGNPQAGLPLLNGGAIAGFFLGLVLVYGTLVPPTVG
ncbi:MAG TPA: presenilin family intramembrane aspartyl protease PSH [Thermoplasmata archaeon]|jgi:presenilin-like A22 family membrane protease